MACSYIDFDETSFRQDIEGMMDVLHPSLLPLDCRSPSRQSSIKFQFSSQNESLEKPDLIQLERGGVICPTLIGPIQYGMPPETVKDSLNLGIDVPSYYIIPTKRFDKKYGISVAEFEFPAYYNFFVNKRQVSLICTKKVEAAIRIVFQETLLGPQEHIKLHLDFYHTFQKEQWPDFAKELSVFSTIPSNPSERLTIDHLLKFELFDPITKTATIKQKDVTIQIIHESDEFTIIQDGKILNSIKDMMTFPQIFNEYIQNKQVAITNKLDYHQVRGSGQTMPQSFKKIQVDSPRLSAPKLVQSRSKSDVAQWKNDLAEFSNSIKSLQNINDGFNNKNNSKVIEQSQESQYKTFTPPVFGVTVLGCSHGFDPKGSTSGYIFWINGRGIMVDPPPYATYHMKNMGIPSILISAVMISHCHADHDAGTFQKILDDTRVEIITTRTIMKSFLRKQSAISGIPTDELKKLFIFRPVIIGTSLNIYGANFDFFYAMHTIPSLGFSVRLQSKSIYFSSDTFYDPVILLEYYNKGIFTKARYEQLAFPKFTENIILHEAGVPPIHTSQKVLAALSDKIKSRMYLVHTAEKDLLKDSGLKLAKAGVENTMVLIPWTDNQNISTLSRLDLLSNIDIFQHLTLKNIRWLLDSLVTEEFLPNQFIVKEGTSGNKFYIIDSGIAKAFSEQKGKEFERYFQIGDYFGEYSVIQDKGLRGANVIALTKLRVLTLEKHDFWFIFGDGSGGQGPIISKMMHLTESRNSKSTRILFKNSILSELSTTQKTQLEMILFESCVEKGTILWKVGDEPQFAFLIKKGTFQYIDCPEQELEEFDSGAFIGEMKCMFDQQPSTTSVRATRKSLIFKISKEDLMNFLSSHPGVYMLLSDSKYIY